MSKVEKLYQSRQPLEQESMTGQVVGVQLESYLIQFEHCVLSAKKAFSCTLQPVVGDKVICMQDEAGEPYILAILHRANSEKARHDFGENTHLKINDLHFDVDAQGRNLISSEEEILLQLGGFKLSSLKGQAFIGEMTLSGAKFTAHFKRAERISGVLEEVADTVNSRFKNSFKWVEGVDQTVAKSVIGHVKELMSWRSKQALITSEKDMRIDGERIHMG